MSRTLGLLFVGALDAALVADQVSSSSSSSSRKRGSISLLGHVLKRHHHNDDENGLIASSGILKLPQDDGSWKELCSSRTRDSESESEDHGGLSGSSSSSSRLKDVRGETGDEMESSSDSVTAACSIQVINNYSSSILVCWVDSTGKLHHYYPVNDGSIKDGSVSNKHTEYTQVGHAFVILKPCSVLPQLISDVKPNEFLCLYKPNLSSNCHTITISPKNLRSFSRSINAKVIVTCEPVMSSGGAVDTSKKIYTLQKIAGFTIMCEPGVFEKVPMLRQRLIQDLEMVRILLPAEAYEKISTTTKLWVNESIVFGPVNDPIQGRACTYHPKGGSSWLRSNGLRVDKSGCVEVYCANDYLESRGLWGTGGVLLHEFSHSYHDQHCDDGFDNATIREAYNKAMLLGLYDAVHVHGKQGENGQLAKAYACANCMEFFAELSVAYLWKRDNSTEYNKWFPHNREQMKEHDQESFDVLHYMWGGC